MLKKILRIFTFLLIGFISLVAMILLSILIFSGNTPEGKTKIAKKVWMNIGGIEQGCFIRGEDEKNPVILFLHGGPGSPELPLINNTELEKHFTVCYWDQRGAGMSYSSKIDLATMTVERFIEDTREVTDSLRKLYGVEKIYLMGHSWGSYLGIKTIEKYPELYEAYIGIGQVTNQLESEKLGYDYVVEQARKAKDTRTVKDFEQYDKFADDFPSDSYLLKVRTNGMNKYGVGIKHKDISMFDLATDLLYYKGYTFTEKLNYLRGTLFSLHALYGNILEDNLFETSINFEIPVYIIQGKYDYQTSYKLAKEYFDTINAPKKAFFTFENSAHSPNIEEHKEFVKVMKQIVEQ